jgi:hypothetical protein
MTHQLMVSSVIEILLTILHNASACCCVIALVHTEADSTVTRHGVVEVVKVVILLCLVLLGIAPGLQGTGRRMPVPVPIHVPSNRNMPVPYRSYWGSSSNNIDLLGHAQGVARVEWHAQGVARVAWYVT